jgi:hypothetical protein
LAYRAGASTFQSGVSTPREWLDTSKAPPVDGKVSKPLTSGRNHRLITGVTVLISNSVKVGSHLAISGLAISVPVKSSPALCSGAVILPRQWMFRQCRNPPRVGTKDLASYAVRGLIGGWN